MWEQISPLFTTHCDAAEPWQLGFQDPASPVIEGIVSFHHDLIFVAIVIIVFVFWVLVRAIWLFREEGSENRVPSDVVHGTALEIGWTVFPSLILIAIAVPSFALLYSIDEVIDPGVTLKVVGHQWYWSYEYTDQCSADEALNFDSYIIPEDDLSEGQFRLLEVDNSTVLPVNTHIRVLVTGADVLHCWAVPSLGVKIDAVPGRLNQVSLYIKREGTFYGQCSEICGVNHGFIPIRVQSVPLSDYIRFLEKGV